MSDEPKKSFGLVQIVWILAGFIVVVAAALHIFYNIRGSSIRFNTPYQAVQLTNGSVYFGHLQDYGTHKPVLTDVYYVVRRIPIPSRSAVRLSKEVKTARTRSHVHKPQPDCFCGDSWHKLKSRSADCPGTALTDPAGYRPTEEHSNWIAS